MITTVTGKNQVTIPAKLATAVGLEAGTRIDWRIGGEGILIARLLPSRSELARKVAGMGRQWLTKDEDPLKQLIEERAQSDSGDCRCSQMDACPSRPASGGGPIGSIASGAIA